MSQRLLKKELEVYAKRAHDALSNSGYSDDEINRAADGLLSGTRILPTTSGSRITVAWRWIESLSYARAGIDNLLSGRLEAARADCVEAREWSAEATQARNDFESGRKGGATPKRRIWADRAAESVTCWEELPGSEHPLEFEDLLVRVYRDGDTLCAADIDDMNADVKTLARSTFEKRYLKEES